MEAQEAKSLFGISSNSWRASFRWPHLPYMSKSVLEKRAPWRSKPDLITWAWSFLPWIGR